MEAFLSSPITWIVFAALSEIIGQSKLKENGVISLVLSAVKRLKPAKKPRSR